MKYLNSLSQSLIPQKLKEVYFAKKLTNVPVQPIDERDWILPANKLFKVAVKDLESFSLRDKTPPVKNQGSIGSCVGHSGRVVYGPAKEFLGSEPSAMHIYKTGQLFDPWPGEDYSGTTIRGAANGLKKVGCCEEKYWPYTGKENAPKVDGYLKNAEKFKINAFYIIDKNKTGQIKKMLTQEPLWTSIMVHRELFKTPRNGVIDSEKYLNSEKAGGHAIAMVGWKKIDKKLYWEFQNSWGTWFGDKGFFFIEDALYRKIIINSNGPFYIETKSEIEPKKPKPEPKAEPKQKKGFLKIINNIIKSVIEIIKKIF